MRLQWWMAPLAVLLVLFGVAGGIYVARPARSQPDRPVQVPSIPGGTPVTQTPPSPPPSAKPVTPAPKPPAPKRPADAEAVAFIRAFMQARMDGKSGEMGAKLAPGLPNKNAIRVSRPDARITAYTADLLGSGDPDSFLFRLRVAFALGQPGGEVAVEEVRLSWKDGLKVTAFADIPKEAMALAPGKDGKMYGSRGQDTALAVDPGALPANFRPFGAEPSVEFGVGKDGWSVASLSLDGGYVLWVTKGLHPLLGVSQVAWNGTPVVTPLDLLFEAGGVDAAFAPGGPRYVAVTVAQPSGATTLTIWDLMERARFGPDLTQHFGAPDYTVLNLRWHPDGKVLNFDVKRGGKTTGPWSYSTTSRNLSQP